MPKGRRGTWWVVLALAVVGLLCVVGRAAMRSEGRALPDDTFWHLTYTIEFRAKKPEARLNVAFPCDTARCRVTSQQIRCPDLTSRKVKNETPKRELTVVAPKASEGDKPYRLTADFELHLSPHGGWREVLSIPASVDARNDYLRPRKGLEVDDPVVTSTLERLQLQPSSKVELVDRLFEYCLAEIGSAHGAPSEPVPALKQGVASPLGRARVFAALCRASKIPARMVTGFSIRQGADIKPHVWVEVLTEGRWEPFDPENGFARELPHNVVPARRDGVSIVATNEVSDVNSTFSLVRVPPPPGLVRSAKRQFLDMLDLTRLPLDMHEVLEVILLMPLGALVTAIFRTLIGIRTFGTFTPTLIALAFVYNDWGTGIFVFVLVMVLGLSSRWLLDKLKLLLVPRLSVILTLVALCIVFAVSFLDFFDLTPSAQAVLLPMVILTMTVERFFLTTEEDGVRFALQLLSGTLVVAACCYLVLRWSSVGKLLLTYPEVHLITVAVFVVLGRYAGYRLAELWRFRDLVASTEGPKT